MQVKIDTKEKFTVLKPLEPFISDIMADEIAALCNKYLDTTLKNVILNLKEITGIEKIAVNTIVKLQQNFYKNNASFIICELVPYIKQIFENAGYTESFNYAPTESEAWDIVQMEEIEREILGDF